MGQRVKKTHAYLAIDDSREAAAIAGVLEELGAMVGHLSELALEHVRDRDLHLVVVDEHPRSLQAVNSHFLMIGCAVPMIGCLKQVDLNAIAESVRSGITAFALMPPQAEDLRRAIVFAESHQGEVRQHFAGQVARQLLGQLTRRQRQIVAGLFRGLTNKQLAHEYEISERTVEVHRARIIDKIMARNTAGLIRLVSIAGPDILGDVLGDDREDGREVPETGGGRRGPGRGGNGNRRTVMPLGFL